MVSLRVVPHQMSESVLERVRDWRPVLYEVANLLRAEFRHQFAVGGDPPWRPLAPSTVSVKQMLGLPSQLRTRSGRMPQRLFQRGQLAPTNILIMTGDLRDSVVQKAHPDHIERVSKERLEIGTKHWLAPIHQYGTRPYRIVPKQKRVLVFYTSSGIRFARAVYHPGVPARPFLRVRESTAQTIRQKLQRYLAGEEWEE